MMRFNALELRTKFWKNLGGGKNGRGGLRRDLDFFHYTPGVFFKVGAPRKLLHHELVGSWRTCQIALAVTHRGFEERSVTRHEFVQNLGSDTGRFPADLIFLLEVLGSSPFAPQSQMAIKLIGDGLAVTR